MTDAQSRVDQIAWYHEFDFGGGVRARTSHENPDGIRQVWQFMEEQLRRVPFAGASVLEIGAWDGYWSFFAERQGAASVLATDDATQRWSGRGGIRLAKQLLQSQVVVREDLPVYEVAALGRTFDVILCLGVYYHLLDPLLAFSQIRHCCHGDTLVVVEGELAWGGMTRLEARYHQSAWQECVLAAPLLEHLLRLSYFRVDEQVWMHPVPDDACSSGELKIDRSMLICRPFAGSNGAYTYRPHFGLASFDDRFAPNAETSRRADLTVVEVPEIVAAGREFTASIRTTNAGSRTWRPLKLVEPAAPILAGHSARSRNIGLDFNRAFLAKRIVPGEYVNVEPVAEYRRHIEENWLEGSITVGAQLWDGAGQQRIDQDYSRGFLDDPVVAGASTTVSVRMIAPVMPGRYMLRFDMVCEYVCWFAAEGSAQLAAPLTVV